MDLTGTYQTMHKSVGPQCGEDSSREGNREGKCHDLNISSRHLPGEPEEPPFDKPQSQCQQQDKKLRATPMLLEIFICGFCYWPNHLIVRFTTRTVREHIGVGVAVTLYIYVLSRHSLNITQGRSLALLITTKARFS